MVTNIVEEDLKRILSAHLPWSEFDGCTILVTGAGGFIPAYMVETLLLLKEIDVHVKVVGLVRNRDKARQRFEALGTEPDILVQDVMIPLQFQDVDYIIHAASQASPKYYGQDPVGTAGANVIGTHNMLSLAKEQRAKGVLFFSSSEVYGQVNAKNMPIREDGYGYLDPTDIRSCYAESKRMGENLCVSWFRQYGVPAKIVRPFHTYGPGMRLDDGRVQADFVADVVCGRDITVRSEGRVSRCFCYLADAVVGFFTVLLKGVPGEAYNIGDDRNELSMTELAETLAELFPPRRVVFGKKEKQYLKSPVDRISPDISKVRSLGWMPTTSMKEGLLRTVRSYHELI